jgi:hypothetical protein
MTQELVANMLGVRREGITEAAGRLQQAGHIAIAAATFRCSTGPGSSPGSASATPSSRRNAGAAWDRRERTPPSAIAPSPGRRGRRFAPRPAAGRGFAPHEQGDADDALVAHHGDFRRGAILHDVEQGDDGIDGEIGVMRRMPDSQSVSPSVRGTSSREGKMRAYSSAGRAASSWFLGGACGSDMSDLPIANLAPNSRHPLSSSNVAPTWLCGVLSASSSYRLPLPISLCSRFMCVPRRTYPAKIFQMAFLHANTVIACVSSRGIPGPPRPQPSSEGTQVARPSMCVNRQTGKRLLSRLDSSEQEIVP